MNLSKILSFVIFSFSVTAVSAQELSGIVTYSYELKSDSSNEFEKDFNAALYGPSSREFTLKFINKESLYEAVPQLENSGMGVLKGDEIIYMNTKENLVITQTEFLGKIFKIVDSLPKRNWIISNDAIKIGNYDCFKATYNYTKSTLVSPDFIENLDKTEDVEKTITAWFTPQIPMAIGPDKYAGLPGLILKLKDGDIVYTCSKIVVNPKDDVKIKIPNKGTEVSQLEYDAIVNKKFQEMQDK